MDFGDVKAGFTKKIGPLPAWAWGVVGAAGIWVWRSMRARSAAEGTPEPGGTEQGSMMYGTMSGAGAPFPMTPPIGGGEVDSTLPSTYFQIPWGEGYLTFEGSDWATLLPWLNAQQGGVGNPQSTSPMAPHLMSQIPASQTAAATVGRQFSNIIDALTGPTPGYLPGYNLPNQYAVPEGNVAYVSYGPLGDVQLLSKPADNFLRMQQGNCDRINRNPEWYTPDQVAACR